MTVRLCLPSHATWVMPLAVYCLFCEVVIPAKSVLSARNPSLMISQAVLSEVGIRVKRVRSRGAENSVHVSEEFPRASIMITLLSKVGLICDISSR